MGKRWYDKHKPLGKYLDSLKDMHPKKRDKLVRGILSLIREHHPDLLSESVMDFPLDLHRRRWYDKNPYLWLIFNGLSYAEATLRKKVSKYLHENRK